MDATPKETIYINNLNEKVKKEGWFIMFVYFFNTSLLIW